MLEVEGIVNSIFDSMTWLLSETESNQVWLVDCGDTNKVLEKTKGKTVEGVLLTHTHSDHIYGLEALLRVFPDVKIHTNQYGIEALCSPKKNLSRYHSDYPDISIEIPNNIIALSEGDVVLLGDTRLQVYETPGHDPSCLTYITEDKAFTGDAYIPGVKIFTGFPNSNRKQAAESVERILQLTTNRLVLPGHFVPEGMGKLNCTL